MAETTHEYDDKLFNLLQELAKAPVRFVVCGGVACVLHGVERSTYDLDIAVDLDENNLRRLIEIAKKFRLVPRIPEPVENLLDKNKRLKWIEEKGAFVYTFVALDNPLQLDIFLKYPINFENLYNNSVKMKISNLEFMVSSKEDLIIAKRNIENLRDKDLIDIKELEKLLNDERKT